jgi:hypothetical protein
MTAGAPGQEVIDCVDAVVRRDQGQLHGVVDVDEVLAERAVAVPEREATRGAAISPVV